MMGLLIATSAGAAKQKPGASLIRDVVSHFLGVKKKIKISLAGEDLLSWSITECDDAATLTLDDAEYEELQVRLHESTQAEPAFLSPESRLRPLSSGIS